MPTSFATRLVRYPLLGHHPQIAEHCRPPSTITIPVSWDVPIAICTLKLTHPRHPAVTLPLDCSTVDGLARAVALEPEDGQSSRSMSEVSGYIHGIVLVTHQAD